MSEYILPKFEVTFDSTSDFSAKDGIIRIIVRSQYTYGKFVKGEAIVSLKPQVKYFGRKADIITRTVKVDGKGVAEFDMQGDLEFGEAILRIEPSQMYSVEAMVVEELTGRNVTATKTITVHKTKYKFTTDGLPLKFQPGSTVEFLVCLKRSGGWIKF